ncbi:MAG: hypothetical protein ABSD28_02430 [Tepidisphaeraceae bacterium]
MLAGVAAAALVFGLRIRRAAWDFSGGAHFKGDVNNALYWGRASAESGFFQLYDAVANGIISEPNRKIDYPPLRLAMAAAWWRWAHRHYPDATQWVDDYDFTAPMLRLNTLAELASCVLVFVLIRLWRRRQAGATRPTAFAGAGAAMAGALLFWFNPAIIWNAHCWPQWDVWPIPFFLAAVLLASLNWWMAAGICLALGASLKGQLLLGAPVLVVWPIVRLQFGSALKLAAGFFLATLLIAVPWMHPSAAAWTWSVAVAVGIACVLPIMLELKLPRRAALGLAAAGMALAWPWHTAGAGPVLRAAPVGLLGLIAFSRWLPFRLRGGALALAIATLILLLMPLFDASAAWFTYGFEYGTEKFDFMVTGSGTYNVPKMLRVYCDWPHKVSDPVTLPLLGEVTFTTFTRIVYGICLALCGIGAAIHDRRRETRFLASMVAPWLLFFMILTQMHGRYSIWAAGLSALLAGVGSGMALLGVLVSIVSLLGMVENQLLFSRDWSPDTLELLRSCDPGLGWVLVLSALIYLYVAVIPLTGD